MGKITTWCLILGLTLLATVGPVVAQSGSGEGFDVEAATQGVLVADVT